VLVLEFAMTLLKKHSTFILLVLLGVGDAGEDWDVISNIGMHQLSSHSHTLENL
jgi:hypothetical protein